MITNMLCYHAKLYKCWNVKLIIYNLYHSLHSECMWDHVLNLPYVSGSRQKNESLRSSKVNQLVVYRILGQSQTRDGATNCVGAFHVLFNKEHHQ